VRNELYGTAMHVDVPTPDGVADAYFTHPAGGPHPPVVLFIDAIGLRPRIEEMADRIAAQGYAVLAPNLFYRAGRAPVIPNIVERLHSEDRAAVLGELRPLMVAFTPEVIASDAQAYVDFLDAQPEVASGPLATTGYCFGGGWSLRAAAQLPDRVVAAASFHGGNLATEDPNSPHLLAPLVTGELYVGHADQDHAMPVEQIERLEKAFTEAGLTYTSELYEGSAHGWTMSDTAMHDAEGEQRHWDALLALLARTL
jgi:carboxymethylenebutenolidase